MKFSEYTIIRINGTQYSKSELLKINKFDLKSEEATSVLLFLKTWFDSSSEIKVQTSGSTGTPKTINIPKQSFIESAINTCNYLNINNKINSLLCIPVKYIGGKMMIIRALVSGYNLIISEPCKNPLLNQKNEINFIAITPYQAYSILEESSKEFENINNVIIGGGNVNENFISKIKDFKNNIYSTFGMTETVSHIALQKLNGKEKSDYYTVLDPYKISVNNENCLIIDCPTLNNSLINTNDIVFIKNNKFKWLGRKDNIINSGGIKIYPEEIEKIITPFLSDMNFYISSVIDKLLGEKLVLKVELSNGNKPKIDLQFLNSHLEKYKSIKEVLYLKSFNYTENGKIKR